MLSRSESISRFLTMDGNNADADFIPSEGFIKNIVEEYFAVKTG